MLAGVCLFAIACGGGSGEAMAPTRPAEQTATAEPSPNTIPSPTPEPPTPAPPTEAPPPPAATTAPPPQPTPTPRPTQAPAGGGSLTLNVVAQNVAFDRSSITVPANTNITVNFRNNDVSVPHDFGVSIPGVPHSATCNGPCTASITFNSGPPGTYTFQCSVHPSMVGGFIVQ